MKMRIGICSKIVSLFGTWWAFLGWTFFIGFIILPFFPGGNLLALIFFPLMLIWWIIDAINQVIPRWQFILGILMILIMFLPFGIYIFAGSWIVYWFKVRE